MPMIDVYATAGTFPDQHRLATDLAAALMTIEQVPDIPMFRQNTAAFIHDLPPGGQGPVLVAAGGGTQPHRAQGAAVPAHQLVPARDRQRAIHLGKHGQHLRPQHLRQAPGQ